jgi:hypothetical protein
MSSAASVLPAGFANGLSNPYHVAFLLALIVLFIVPAILVGRLAERKGRSFSVYLVASLMIGWPVPLLAALVMPNRREQGSSLQL